MTIDEAKRVRIVDFLAQLGHRAQERGDAIVQSQ